MNALVDPVASIRFFTLAQAEQVARDAYARAVKLCTPPAGESFVDGDGYAFASEPDFWAFFIEGIEWGIGKLATGVRLRGSIEEGQS